MSRRRALAVFGGAASAALVGACGSTGESVAPGDMAYIAADHSGARLSAILRSSFISEANELVVKQINEWSALANASLTGRLSEDWREAYAAVAIQREGDDLAEMFGASPHLYANQLIDVSDVAEELGSAYGGWIDVGRDTAVIEGVWRAIPWMYTAHALNYREDFLDAVGASAPETYDDLLQTATLLSDRGQPLVGFSMNELAPNDSSSLAYSMMWSFGGHEVDETGKRVTIDSAGTRAALAYFAELSQVSHQGSLAFAEGDNNEAFLDSAISMTQNASSIYWRALRDAPQVAEAMNHVKFPTGPAGYHQLVEQNSIAIFSHSRNVDAAKDWIRYMMHPAQLRPRAEVALSFFTPSLGLYVDDPGMPWNTDPKLGGMRGIHDGGHLPGWPGPASIEANLVYENATIMKMFQSAGSDNCSIDEAIAIAEHALRRVYET